MPNVCEFMAYEGQDWMSGGKSCTKDKYITLPQPPLLYHHQHTVAHSELGANVSILELFEIQHMLSDLLHSALEVLYSDPEDI